jgi:hypothetical protein
MSMKNSSDTIRNRTRGLPVCSAVPQSTVPHKYVQYLKILVAPSGCAVKVWVCRRSRAGIVSLNPAGGMDVCLL